MLVQVLQGIVTSGNEMLAKQSWLGAELSGPETVLENPELAPPCTGCCGMPDLQLGWHLTPAQLHTIPPDRHLPVRLAPSP
jgi:hypothetical protein